MGVQKRTRKYAKVKRIIGQKDARLYVRFSDPPSIYALALGRHWIAYAEGITGRRTKAKVKQRASEKQRAMISFGKCTDSDLPWTSIRTDHFDSPQVSSSLFFQVCHIPLSSLSL